MGRKKSNQNTTLEQVPMPPAYAAEPVAAARVKRPNKTDEIGRLKGLLIEAEQFVALHAEARAQAERNCRAAKKRAAELRQEITQLVTGM